MMLSRLIGRGVAETQQTPYYFSVGRLGCCTANIVAGIQVVRSNDWLGLSLPTHPPPVIHQHGAKSACNY